MTNPLSSGFRGPLAPYADAFAQQLREQGYAAWTVHDKLHLVAKLSQWLEERQLPVGSLDEQRVCTFLEEFHGHERRTYHGDRTTLRELLRQLSAAGVIPEPTAEADEGASARIVGEFRQYLIQERGLAVTTVDTYAATALRFLNACFGDGAVELLRRFLLHVLPKGFMRSSGLCGVADCEADPGRQVGSHYSA
ncbi:MAG: hypothetical protein U9Q81_01265 [Pseudomonadota bacterium]|nr:hypothetical protein [Pseudomonadota bacterium]